MNCCVMRCNRTAGRSSECFRTWVLRFTGFKVGGWGGGDGDVRYADLRTGRSIGSLIVR